MSLHSLITSLYSLYQRAYCVVIERIRLAEVKSEQITAKKKQLFSTLHDHQTSQNLVSECSTKQMDIGSMTRVRAPVEKHVQTLTILEIGVGSAANFEYYPSGSRIICVDPNPHFKSYVQSRMDEFPNLNTDEFEVGGGESLSVASNSIDAVVCTLVLCSVQEPAKVLSEVHRVLKPGGRFYFYEHVAAEENSWLKSMQNLLNPFWRLLSDNCHVNRRTWQYVEDAGFSSVQQDFFSVKPLFLRLISPRLIGTATK